MESLFAIHNNSSHYVFSLEEDIIELEFLTINTGCEGDDTSGSIDMTISGGVGPYQVTWSNSSETEDIENLSANWYYVTVIDSSDPQESAVDSVQIIYESTPYLNLGYYEFVCGGDTVVLNALNEGSSYLWSTGQESQTIELYSSGLYSVTVSNTCGSIYDSIRLISDQSDLELNLPNDTTIC